MFVDLDDFNRIKKYFEEWLIELFRDKDVFW